MSEEQKKPQYGANQIQALGYGARTYASIDVYR